MGQRGEADAVAQGVELPDVAPLQALRVELVEGARPEGAPEGIRRHVEARPANRPVGKEERPYLARADRG